MLNKNIMNEWIPSDKWCDVYLVCRGKIFGSHRLVLASASTFLKDCLLSCPLEETPVFIILPEFDTDMLLLVLYYVYNGEVIVQGSQMKMFLELINVLQIFVDSQYLQKNSSLEQNVGHHYDVDNNYRQANVLNLDTPTFLYANDENKQFNNVKKDIISFNALNKIKYSCDNKYFAKTKQETYSNLLPKGNGVTDINFEFGDRQKQPFSSDFCIKTCLSGKNSGVAQGVLAISNEHYQEATSLLSTNANDILRSMTLLKNSQITSKSEYTNLIDVLPERHDETYHISKSVYESRTVDLTETKRYEMNNLEATKCNDFREKNVLHKNQIKIITSIEHNVTRINSKLLTNVPCNNSLPFSKIKVNEKELKSKTKNTLNKVTIHNQVLQSPWCPILPDNFRPILRRDHEVELSEVFPNNDAFAAQMRQNSSHYICMECDKSFSQLRNFKYHMSVHRGTKEFAITCPVCGKYFNDRGYLSSHMKIHRNRKEYKCSLCPKSFNQRVAYNMHVRIHTGVKPHVCDDCGKAFSRKMLLKQHQRTHSGERPYACSYCDKKFADRSNMTLHLRLHTGIKPFVCNLCPKAFTKKHHLKSHLNFHTGEKPYSCPRCKLAFTQSSNMRTHYKKCII